MRIPTFSRQSGSDTSDGDRPAPSGGTPAREPADTAGGGSVAEPTEATTSRWNETDRNVRGQGGPGTPTTYGTPQAGATAAPVPAPEAGPQARANPYALASSAVNQRSRSESRSISSGVCPVWNAIRSFMTFLMWSMLSA